MTELFNGVAGLLSGTFGAKLSYHPQSGQSREIMSIFREAPIEVEGADGQIVRIEAPSWRVSRDLAPEIRRGDRITLGDGRIFAVMVVHSGGSPAMDAYLICECQIVEEV